MSKNKGESVFGKLPSTNSSTVKSFSDIDFDWQELEDTFVSVSDELAQNLMRVKALLSSDRFKDSHELQTFKYIMIKCETMAGTLSNNLSKIHAQHNKRKGKLQDSDDYWLATKLHTHYKSYRSDMLLAIASVSKSIILLSPKEETQ